MEILIFFDTRKECLSGFRDFAQLLEENHIEAKLSRNYTKVEANGHEIRFLAAGPGHPHNKNLQADVTIPYSRENTRHSPYTDLKYRKLDYADIIEILKEGAKK